jgi:cation diffusion facilitator family transporter
MAAARPEPPTAERSASEASAQQRTALLSVAAACFLVAVKLGAGLVTNSLGLIAEAAHSGTDLVAALLTLYAVRIAVRPADEEHHYGHGKAEHLAALAESTFLMAVSAFLAYQAVARLTADTAHHVDTTWWSFLVLAIVIGVDASRAVVTRRAARRHHSAALASNALHFASDLGGSLAVLLGLVFVALGEPRADSIAALIVAAIVLVAAARLARQSIAVLMDRADADADAAVRRALEDFGDIEVRRLRSRHAAGRDFVDLVVAVSADAGLAQAHTTADAIESAIRRQLPASDVVVHVEPRAVEGDLREKANAAALSVPEVREVHNVRVMHIDGRPELSLHVKLPRELALGEAHAVVERLEGAVREAVPELRGIHTHIEPLSDADWATRPGRDETAQARGAIEEVVSRYTGRAPARVSFRDADRGRVALIDVLLPADQPLPSAHRRAGVIEEAVRQRCPELADVIVHTEPATASTTQATR